MNTALNLLPPANKRQLRSSYVLAHLQTLLSVLFVVALFAAGTIFGVRWLVKRQYDDLAARSVSGENESKSVSAQIRDYNGYLARIEDINKRALPVSPMLLRLGGLAPQDVLLERIQLGAGGAMVVSGMAATRDALIDFETKLKADPDFRDVKSPISNLVTQTDIKFDFTFKYGPAADLAAPPPPPPVVAPPAAEAGT